MKGEILRTEQQSDRESVTQEVREKIMEISDIPFEKIESEFAAFRDSMEMLKQWRRFIAAKDIIRNRGAFVYTPKGKLTIPVDASTRRADPSMTVREEEIRNRIRQNPERYDDQTKVRHRNRPTC